MRYRETAVTNLSALPGGIKITEKLIDAVSSANRYIKDRIYVLMYVKAYSTSAFNLG